MADLDLEVDLGNNVLDGGAIDEVSKRLKTCEERLYAAEDFNREVRISELIFN